jgi:hypothetical protein
LRIVFGAGFQAASEQMGQLLVLYAASTGIYALAVVLMAYEMSRRLANTGLVQLVFSGAIVAGITLFHTSLRDVVIVQLVAMIVLLVTVCLPFFRVVRVAVAGSSSSIPVTATSQWTTGSALTLNNSAPGMKLVRPVPETEVIAEFLRSEFHHAEFDRDRERFQRWVADPDVSNDAENALRRALLFRRRETMWRELPPDTEWWQVEVTTEDLKRIRVFPRAQWRRIAAGDFLLTNIVERVHGGQVRRGTRTAAFLKKLLAFSAKLREQEDGSAILLIGVDQEQPLTIIEGNHRMTAAMLASPEIALKRFRYLCGFSPRMTECCWYQTKPDYAVALCP